MQTQTDNLPATINEADAAANILAAANENSGFEKILKFRKGEYLIDDEVVPIGKELLAHPEAWTKIWIKFVDGKVAEKRRYRVALNEIPPERDELDATDQSTWGPGLDGRAADPWTMQYLLPLETVLADEIVVFVTTSVGGRRAISDLCRSYAKRTKKNGYSGQPIVALQAGEMPTRSYGKVSCPKFEIVGWDDEATGSVLEDPPVTSEAEFQDEIPF